MAISFVASGGSSLSSNSASLTLTKPTGVQVGDVLIAHIHGDVQTVPNSVPTGWTQILAQFNGVDQYGRAYYRVVDGTEGASFSWGTANLANWAGVILAYRGVQTATPAVASAGSSGSSSSPTLASITPGVSGCLQLGLFGSWSSTTLTQPAGMTSRASLSTTISLQDADVALAGSGATGTRTGSASASVPWVTLSIALQSSNQAPNAPTGLAPAVGTVDRSVIQRLSWTFSDPNAGDSQSKFDLQWRHKGTTDAWNTVSQTTPSNYYDVPASTFPAEDIEWQVRTYDQAAAVGPYSALAYFTAANAATPPTITAPTSGGTVSQNPTNVAWSTAGQQGYQVRRVRDNAGVADTTTVYYDTGQITDTTTRTVSVPFETNNRWEHVQVRVQQGGLWSAWSDVRVNVSYTSPAVASLVATANNATGSIGVAITNPTPSGGQPTVSYNDVYVRTVGDTGAGVRIATGVANNGTATYWTPASGVAYEFLARTFGSNSTSTDSAWTA